MKELLDEFRPWPRGILTTGALAGAIVAIAKFAKDSALLLSDRVNSIAFSLVCICYVSTVAFGGILFFLLRAYLKRPNWDEGLEALHHSIESVRTACLDKSQFNTQQCLSQLGEGVSQYLRVRLGDRNVSVTVKVVQGELLVVAFRDGKQSTNRKNARSEPMDRNYIYRRMDVGRPDSESSPPPWIMVRNTKIVADTTLKNRAADHGYNSALAVPLVVPMLSDDKLNKGWSIGSLRGFLGIDARRAKAFDRLFGRPLGSCYNSNEGVRWSPRLELNFLYGIADALVTIISLHPLPQRLDEHSPGG